jgi:hypothetical protein
MKPSHHTSRDSGRYFIKPSSSLRRDQASQQRVLLRIQTAFPFHCIDFMNIIATPKQNKGKRFSLQKQGRVLSDINSC